MLVQRHMPLVIGPGMADIEASVAHVPSVGTLDGHVQGCGASSASLVVDRCTGAETSLLAPRYPEAF